MQDYKIEKIECSNKINLSVEQSLKKSSVIKDYVIVRRGLLGNIAIRSFSSYDIFCDFFKNVSLNCQAIVKETKCKRVLFIVEVEDVNEKILGQYQKMLMFDKEFNLEMVSYEVAFIEKGTKSCYFGGTSEKGKTLMYRDTIKLLVDLFV